MKEDGCTCRKATGLLGVVDIFLDGKLHGFHHKVRAIGYSISIVVGKEVVSKFLPKGMCNVASNEALDRSRDGCCRAWWDLRDLLQLIPILQSCRF